MEQKDDEKVVFFSFLQRPIFWQIAVETVCLAISLFSRVGEVEFAENCKSEPVPLLESSDFTPSPFLLPQKDYTK